MLTGRLDIGQFSLSKLELSTLTTEHHPGLAMSLGHPTKLDSGETLQN